MKNYIREKKKKSFYGKWINPVLWLYLAFFCLCCLPVVIIMVTVPYDKFELALCITVAIVVVAFLAGSLGFVFLVINRLKRAQANRDFARYDFSPYTSDAEAEEFYSEYHLCRYTVTASPFDEDGSLEFKTDDEVKEYISQHFAQTLLKIEDFYNGVEKSTFFINFYSGSKEGATIRVDKKTDGEHTTLDLTEQDRVTFCEEGIKVAEKLYLYANTEATVITGFGKETDFYVSILLIISLEDDGYLSFLMSSRIAEIVKRFNIKVVNRDKFDYILADPKHALEQTALQLGLRKLK